ncbi:MAG TPA: MlaE family lipid ABC transporter permease subunit [Kofleriaceae bacterium]|nr:MlaE family lipid ABC transporter permease subunit [Kofleriaceae bacterium]
MNVQVERSGGTALVKLQGDVVVATTPRLYRCLRKLASRRDVRQVVIDFGGAGRLDTSGVAAVSLGSRLMERAGKGFDLRHLGETHQAAFELLPSWQEEARRPRRRPAGLVELVGDRFYATGGRARELGRLLADVARESVAVLARRRHLPAGVLVEQASGMGMNAMPIVGLLSFLLGMTLAFQSAVQLEQFGADVYVADLVGVAMVREFAPMMTAIILTGRTGAAIAAELGTMRVREEVDALRVMGVSPVRYLVLPRLYALTLVQPALTLCAMFIGVAGGMLIAALLMDLSPVLFWERIVARVEFNSFLHGLLKSLVFAWIIGVTACFTGLRTRGGAASVGNATTRTVVASIFLIIVVDSIFATVSTYLKYQ